MSDATFETFLVSGLLVLIAAIGYLAWSAWRWVDRERDMERRALDGIAYEQRSNIERMLKELSGVAKGTLTRDIEIIPIVHPQLDALLARPNEADRRGLTKLRATYNELSAHKQSLRHAFSNNLNITAPADLAVEATIGALATLYLWEEHKGRPPEAARTTRSWDVRNWMKASPFHADLLPGLHLRDQVVERLRTEGMTLTPKPLTHTAHEFYSMRYDRKADPNAPFWKRKKKAADAPSSEPAPAAVAPSPAPETVAAPVSTPLEPATESPPDPKATPTGSVL